MSTSILLVDDHPIFLAGLRALLEDEPDMSVVGEAGDGRTALEMIQKFSPAVVIMDITMPGLNGIEATKQIVSDFPETKVIALSIHSEKEFVEDMLHAGAVGYIVKESVPEELVKGIRVVIGGEAYLSPVITGLIVSQFRKSKSREKACREKSIEIIETKLYCPLVPGDHVHRPRLMALLEQNRQLPLLNSIAPAGYGKTSLVSCWLKNHDWPSAWISLDTDDNDLYRFVYYFIHAVQTCFPMALSQSCDLLDASSLPPLQVLAGRLANELNLIEQDFILVLDDFHFIREKQIHDLITEVLQHPPKKMHLILVGRSDPFLPITKFRAKGQLEEIRLHDLRFTQAETVEFLQPMADTVLEEKTICELVERTEGWITGLRLAALSIRHKSDFNTILSELKGSPEYVMEYLFHEVLSSQSRQVRDCLLKTSILKRFCAPLCGAVFGTSDIDSWDFITLLKNENLFTLKLDTENLWFRYHQLFQRLLQTHLTRRTPPQEIAALHGRACDWFVEAGLPDEAVFHALSAGNVQAAALIVEQNRRAFLDADQWQTLENWLAKLPRNIKQDRPELLLSQAWIQLMMARVAQIAPIIDHVRSLVDNTETDPLLLSEIRFFQGLLEYFHCRPEASVAFLTESATLLPKNSFVVLRSEIEYWTCLALHLNGQKQAAVQRLRQGINSRKIQDGIILSRLRFGMCFIHMLDGEWEQALPEGFQMMEVCQSNHLGFAGTWARYVQGTAALQRFDLEAAQHHFIQVVENRYIANHRMAADAMAGLAITHQLMGRPDEADQTMTLAKTYGLWTKEPGNIEVVHSCQARLALLRGTLTLPLPGRRL